MQRERMVRDTIQARGVHDPRVLQAMRQVPRHLFVPPALRASAYDDTPLPIGHEQTISQPYIVALMSELAEIGHGRCVLEIGTGSGYQTAVLTALGAEVYTLETRPELLEAARRSWSDAGVPPVQFRVGDGRLGWPEAAPFDAILVGAAATSVPPALLEQLHPDGRLVVPVGNDDVQELWVFEPTPWGEHRRRTVCRVLFVPLM
ncbi:MAG: protein-L-isoaspartate(D-aspartate) O-methyltransferase [Myxococcales bacterium]|nr:protein-L-isoaspartate(D-aspartate) O-methyltransferase [Myxococcales bacterium]